MLSRRTRRLDNSINAGSMADIAFLLLIFFLVTTKILEEQGIRVKLPPWEETPPVTIPDKNILKVYVNARDELMVEEKKTSPQALGMIAEQFILNPEGRPDLPSKPSKAIISLLNDRGTSYGTYLEVYNELQAVYNTIWEKEAQQRYQSSFDDLGDGQRKAIRKDIPLVISEAELTSFEE